MQNMLGDQSFISEKLLQVHANAICHMWWHFLTPFLQAKQSEVRMFLNMQFWNILRRNTQTHRLCAAIGYPCWRWIWVEEVLHLAAGLNICIRIQKALGKLHRKWFSPPLRFFFSWLRLRKRMEVVVVLPDLTKRCLKKVIIRRIINILIYYLHGALEKTRVEHQSPLMPFLLWPSGVKSCIYNPDTAHLCHQKVF